MYDENGKPIDVIPEEMAIRRGMSYRLDRHGKVYQAEDEAPLLIDRLYNHEIIAADHHFYGVQFLTMRKVFLAPVGFKIGMMLVRRDDEQAGDKPIPMQDTDYLRVLRGVKNVTHQRLLRDVCDELANPETYPLYGRQTHTVIAAFDALCDAVKALWEEKGKERDAK
jgi:hypothetical protein